jgi:phytol kinase
MLSKFELRRQLMHIFVGVLAVILLYFDILRAWSIFLLIIVGILASLLSKRIRVPFFSYFLELFERKDDKNFPGKGMIFLFIGILLVLKLFDKDIALAAIMVLALGDSISHIFGAQFGKIKNLFNGDGKKLLEGTLAGTVMGFLGAVIFVPVPEAFMGSLVAMIAEVVKFDLNDATLDDNLIVPLVAGTVMFLVRMYV